MVAESFSLTAYRKLITTLIGNECTILPAGIRPKTGGRVVYLRHDIDYSLPAAVEIARINHDLGVCGCFHLPACSPLINLAADINQLAINNIRALGQSFALHFYLPASELLSGEPHFPDIVQLVHDQHRSFAELVGEPVLRAMSWHNPSVLGESCQNWVGREIPDLLNLYTLSKIGIRYYSDSNNRYSVEEWSSIAESIKSPTQILIHPFQWVFGHHRMEVVLARLWQHLIQIQESVFLTNVVYRALLPNGLPESATAAMVAPLLEADCNLL